MRTNTEKWTLEWYWNPLLMLLTIHVFPHRTFIIRTSVIDENLFPYLAGLCYFNVLLGQNTPLKAHVNSSSPLPVEIEQIANHLEAISEGRFGLKFNNLGDCPQLKTSKKKILLFSGGKDSLWQLNYISEKHDPSEFSLLYVSGTTIAGEYVQEQVAVKELAKSVDVNTVSVESFDYTPIGLVFSNRPRWRSLLLITIARLFSDEIWTGISSDKRYISGKGLAPTDKLTFFSETPQTLQGLAKMLNCNIWLSPPESYCFFDIESQKHSYRSCYSPDILCSPETDFENSCWKCRTLHIYQKIGKRENLSSEEKSFFNSNDWLGDSKEEIVRNAKLSESGEPVCIIGKDYM